MAWNPEIKSLHPGKKYGKASRSIRMNSQFILNRSLSELLLKIMANHTNFLVGRALLTTST